MGQAWSAAIGLQDVDGLKPSKYLYETAKKNIEGEITIDEAGKLIKSYYESKEGRKEPDSEEADKVSQRIAKLLSEKAFVFSPAQYISIHRELFQGIFSHAGQLRDYIITKREWVNEKNELHNRDMHISGLMTRKKDVDPINDPLNDPIKKSVLTKREQQIINLLREDKRLTRAEMAGILNCSDATVKRALQSMGEKGVLRRIGSKKTGEWIIIE